MEELDTPMYSTGQMTRMIAEAFRRQFPRSDNEPYRWIRDVYLGHPTFGDAAIVNAEMSHYLAGLDLSGDMPVFAARDQWQEVRPTYEPVQQQEEPEAMIGAEAETEIDLEPFLESATAIDLKEAEGAGPRDPLSLRFVMIKPGFGNPKDNHYYPRDVLERDAHRFVGAKMYATDHRAEQRSVLTEVAVIDRITGFTDDGAPIAEAVVWGPDFAEQVRNRAKVGKLDLLECSIIGRGKAKRGKVDGRSAKIVQEIEEGRAVDWVSRAGAGGHALDILESDDIDNGGETVDEKEKERIEESADPAAEVNIQENGTQGEQSQEEETEVKTQEATLSQDTVTTLLSESGLGEKAQRLLGSGRYETEDDVATAIQEMKGLIKEATGAGKPFAQGAAQTQGNQQTDEEWFAELAKKWGSTYATPEVIE